MRLIQLLTPIVFLGCSVADRKPAADVPASAPAGQAAAHTDTLSPARPAAGVAVPRPGEALVAADFYVDGVRDGFDSAAVRRAAGAPDSVGHQRFLESSEFLPTWNYRGRTILFSDEALVISQTLTAPGLRTARGVQVGDSVSAVLAAYGLPQDSGSCYYLDASDASGLHVLEFGLVRGRVASILVGYWLD